MQVMAFSKGFIWKKAKIGVVIAAETEAQLNSELDAAATTLTQWRLEQGKRASAVMVTIMANEEHVEEYAGRARSPVRIRERPCHTGMFPRPVRREYCDGV